MRALWVQVPMVVLTPLQDRKPVPGAVVSTKPVRPDRLASAIIEAQEGRHAPLPDGESGTLASTRFQGRVLVVDDHPINRRLACLMLEQAGVTALTAENGAEALKLLVKDLHIDLVLMDCQMPVLDGFTATMELRRHETAAGRPRLPVVALTGNALNDECERSLAAGMDIHLTKPLRERDLLDVLARFLPQAKAEPIATITPMPVPITTSSTDLDEVIVATLRSMPAEDGVSPHLFAELVTLFRAEYDERFGALVTALMLEDAGSARLFAHTLKGSCTALGMVGLGREFTAVEGHVRAADLASAVQAIAGIEATWERTCAQVESDMRGSP
jgi:CheY-like chemotaxis protein/HPt (histidine-containing phosphotransfer) domain-containing protein